MSNTIQIKRSSTAAAVPTAGQLAVGELAVNLVDKKLYTKDAVGAVVELTPDIQDGIRDELNATGTAPLYACRAWVNFNGTGTVAIRASGNVSSITDNGTGDYTVNFTTAMPDANYSPQITGISEIGSGGESFFRGVRASSGTPTLKSTTQLRVYSSNYINSAADTSEFNVAIFR